MSPLNQTKELAEVRLILDSQWIGEGPLYLSTFLSQLQAFHDVHTKEPKYSQDVLESCSITEAYQILEGIVESNYPEDLAWSYNCLYNLDDLLDNWDIWVFDTQNGKCKRIIFKRMSEDMDSLRSVEVRTTFFLSVIESVLKYYDGLLET